MKGKLKIIIPIIIVIVTIVGIVVVKNERTGTTSQENAENTTKNFESEQEVYDYANDIIINNDYSNLKATVSTTNESLTISSKTMTEVTESNDFVNITFNIKSPTELISHVKVQNELKNESKSILDIDWYNIQMLVKIQKYNVSLDTNNWYTNKSIIISSSKGIYEFGGNDSTIIANHDRSKNTGTVTEPKYSMTSEIGYNLYNMNKFREVISGDNVIVTLVLAKGTNEYGEEERIKLDLSNSEVLKDLSNFSKDYFMNN